MWQYNPTMKKKPQTNKMSEQELVAHLEKMFAAEDYFTGVLGNRNSFFIAKPARRRKAVSRKPARATS